MVGQAFHARIVADRRCGTRMALFRAGSAMGMTDEALGLALAPNLPEADRLKIVNSLTPAKRAACERLIWTADELNAGRVPEGVIACR